MRRLSITIIVALAISLTGVATPSANASQSSTIDTVAEWYDVTAATVATGTRPQVTNSRIWAIGWLAAARAVRTVPPGLARQPYQEAGLASAVHEALVALVPERVVELDAALAATLARIPAGPAKDRGVAAGQREAQRLLADRAGDGLDPASVNPAFDPGPAVPGTWQPTPPAFAPAIQAGTRFAAPFLLGRGDRFRLPAPPPLGSPRYHADLVEVRDYGAVDSPVRSQAQTDNAQFWLGSSLTIYDGVLRAALVQSRRSFDWRVALVAIFHVVLVDAQIATSDTKYAYRWWRPVTALRAADTGDPAIASDPSWTPLHPTPAHPDYPSGHNTYAGAAEGVLTALIGPRSREPFTITSPSAPGVTRTYTGWHRLTVENIDARVWSGIHTRTADEAGARLGLRIAAYDLARASLLFAG
jgi:hypothetical protein